MPRAEGILKKTRRGCRSAPEALGRRGEGKGGRGGGGREKRRGLGPGKGGLCPEPPPSLVGGVEVGLVCRLGAAGWRVSLVAFPLGRSSSFVSCPREFQGLQGSCRADVPVPSPNFVGLQLSVLCPVLASGEAALERSGTCLWKRIVRGRKVES